MANKLFGGTVTCIHLSERDVIMKTFYTSAIVLAASVLSADHVLATESCKTKEDVRAELREAQRTGDILANDESGKKLNELYPNRYAQRDAIKPMQLALCMP